jgi:hypothetical protein
MQSIGKTKPSSNIYPRRNFGENIELIFNSRSSTKNASKSA